MTIVLDAQLIVLFAVGMASRDYIGRHRRLKGYTEVDFDLLRQILSHATKIVLTPNTLTEASNLAGYIAEPARSHIYGFFRVLIDSDVAEELYLESSLAAAHGKLARLGLTDCVLLNTVTAKDTLLTADLELYLSAVSQGSKAVNFNHLRQL